MTYTERAGNLFISATSLFEDAIYDRLTPVYRAHLAAHFPSALALPAGAALALVNAEELFEFPRPITHKIVYVGGLGEEEDEAAAAASASSQLAVSARCWRLARSSWAALQEFDAFVGDAPAGARVARLGRRLGANAARVEGGVRAPL